MAMMPVLMDQQDGLISRKSPAANQRDRERLRKAAQDAVRWHNHVIHEHGATAADDSHLVERQLPDSGVTLIGWPIRSDLIRSDDPKKDAYDLASCLQAAVHAAAEHNLVLLEHWPWLPDLYQAHVRYISDPNAWQIQTLKSIPLVKEQGGSDCKNLAAYRLAHKWRDELQPEPKGFGKRMSRCKIYCRFIPPEVMRNLLPAEMRATLPDDAVIGPGRLFHAEVRSPDSPQGYTTPDGIVEDMSRYLGM
jgi:hypothetical protein